MAATATDPAATFHLTEAEKRQYERDGVIVKRGVFAKDECDALVAYATAAAAGAAPGSNLPPQQSFAEGGGAGWGQAHLADDTMKAWMLDERLRAPLSDVSF